MKDWVMDVTLEASLATTPQLHGAIVERFRAMAPVLRYLNRPLVARKPAQGLTGRSLVTRQIGQNVSVRVGLLGKGFRTET